MNPETKTEIVRLWLENIASPNPKSQVAMAAELGIGRAAFRKAIEDQPRAPLAKCGKMAIRNVTRTGKIRGLQINLSQIQASGIEYPDTATWEVSGIGKITITLSGKRI